MNKYGFYTVGEKKIFATAAAFIESKRSGHPIQFDYHNDVFAAVSQDKVDRMSLAELYRDRAQQLRDSYDYLSLQYSGGSDSHNVLMTFLKNNIKLDQVVVKIPKWFVDKGYHKPNIHDTSATNLLSEWEYVIKPDLEYLAKNHPEIEITIIDWMEDPMSKISERCFEESIGTLYLTFRLKHPVLSVNKRELEMLGRGKTVGIIYGVDKPDVLARADSKSAYFTMNDKHIRHHPATIDNPLGTEYFYFSPAVPEIPHKMAKSIFQWFRANPMFQDYLYPSKMRETFTMRFQFLNSISKSIVYPYWDVTRFQVQKNNLMHDLSPGVTESDFPVYSSGALHQAIGKWQHLVQSYYKEMDTEKLLRGETFPPIPSKYYYLGEL